jgi:hypothetical protein
MAGTIDSPQCSTGMALTMLSMMRAVPIDVDVKDRVMSMLYISSDA